MESIALRLRADHAAITSHHQPPASSRHALTLMLEMHRRGWCPLLPYYLLQCTTWPSGGSIAAGWFALRLASCHIPRWLAGNCQLQPLAQRRLPTVRSNAHTTCLLTAHNCSAVDSRLHSWVTMHRVSAAAPAPSPPPPPQCPLPRQQSPLRRRLAAPSAGVRAPYMYQPH